jgi:hypothetical protein
MPRDPTQSNSTSWPKRIGWLVLIWAASVAALGIVALLIRAGMHAAGMS